MTKRFFLIIFVIYFSPDNLECYGQDDTVMVSFEKFMGIVKTNHPVSRQADLMLEVGKANLKKARGNFDPVLKSNYDQKQFEDKNYYQLNTNEIKLPTILGLEMKAGYDNNTGVFVNPENELPNNGLAYAGIAVPLGKGLFFDERRQALRQAEIYDKATALERVVLLNQLIFEASKAYWDWYAAWNTYEIFSEAVRLAEFRFDGINESFVQGDVPAIDTLEAYILVQNRQLSRNEALIDLRQTVLEASNFLWSEELEPLVLFERSKPMDQDELNMDLPVEESQLELILADLERVHPQLRLYTNKLEHLNIERRMKAEKIKPKFNVNYNVLNQPVNGNFFEGYSSNDYKWGFEFSMPLFLRKERGDLQITKLKINQTDLQFQQKGIEVQNKIRAYQVEINNLNSQIELFRQAVENYQALLRGERRKFEEGESSLFLVNSRETSLITAQVKLIELLGKYQKSKAGLIRAIGGLEILQ